MSGLPPKPPTPTATTLLVAEPLKSVYPPLETEFGQRAASLRTMRFLHGIFLQVFSGEAGCREDVLERFDLIFEAHSALRPTKPDDPAVVARRSELDELLAGPYPLFLEPPKGEKQAPTFNAEQVRRSIATAVQRTCPFIFDPVGVRESGSPEERRTLLRLAWTVARIGANSFRMGSVEPELMAAFLNDFRGWPFAVFREISTALSHSCTPTCRFRCLDGKLEVQPYAKGSPHKPWTVNFEPHANPPPTRRQLEDFLALQPPATTDEAAPPAPVTCSPHHRAALLWRFGADVCTCDGTSLQNEAEQTIKEITLDIAQRCGSCGRRWTERALLRCGACKVRRYCDSACQLSDWNGTHRARCPGMVGWLGKERIYQTYAQWMSCP